MRGRCERQDAEIWLRSASELLFSGTLDRLLFCRQKNSKQQVGSGCLRGDLGVVLLKEAKRGRIYFTCFRAKSVSGGRWFTRSRHDAINNELCLLPNMEGYYGCTEVSSAPSAPG